MTQAWGWAYLIASGLIDVAWAASMKKADGFREPLWTVVSVGLLIAFVYLLTKALQVLPIGNAYAVWTGIGAAGAVGVGIVAFHEPVSALRLMFVGIIVGGIIGLNLTTR